MGEGVLGRRPACAGFSCRTDSRALIDAHRSSGYHFCMNRNRCIVTPSLLLSLLTLPLFLGTCANLAIESLINGFFDGFNTTLLAAVEECLASQ